MIFSASQIVGLIEIETESGTGSECLIPLGHEEPSLGELLSWLTGPMARPLVADHAAEPAVTASPTNRLTGRAVAGPVALVNADLEQLETDLADAAAQFRLRLTAITSAD
ncbi:MAG TPA: hypothetical protein VGG30_05725 [Pirellulales bacterium]|jgi:hypothetical protein